MRAILNKKGVMGAVVSAFLGVLVLIVVIGMTFLFTSQLKSQVATSAGSGNSTLGQTTTAWLAVNATEKAGADLVNYIPLVLLAIIFGVILMVVLKVIMPYVGGMGGSSF